ncbi:hypothetical protein FE257_007574 [Aspergillus nanangensis]|uniref:Uncharacterized protein n=1 Tax=Aspergillus nanangensis TaxID=2582783 RepID=A0AAD4CMP8_ASPNN|nr:hypothetical protein FE257_007574 [Aspergillus nanangensis]
MSETLPPPPSRDAGDWTTEKRPSKGATSSSIRGCETEEPIAFPLPFSADMTSIRILPSKRRVDLSSGAR